MIDKPDFTLSDPERAAFEQRYRGLRPPHFRGGDVTMCRPMTKLELEQFRAYRASQGRDMPESEYQMPF